MLTKTILPAQMWSTLQESRIPSNFSSSYLLLLSALDKGWRIEESELVPSWDQHGVVYLVNLHLDTLGLNQQLILPQNPLIVDLLQDHCSKIKH